MVYLSIVIKVSKLTAGLCGTILLSFLSGPIMSVDGPQIVLTFTSRDFFGRDVICGYGTTHIPHSAGALTPAT